MNHIDPNIQKWLSGILHTPFKATKHIHAHQDEVYKLQTPQTNYYLKISPTLTHERDNLKKLEGLLNAPKVIDFCASDDKDYLLISELPGKNLVELIGEWANIEIVGIFAKAVRQLHSLDVTQIFPQAGPHDVLVHGDMALPNIIISDEQEIGYIDFGQMTFGTPELDVADSIWSLQRNMGPDYGELFLKEYGHVTMTPKIEKALAFRYGQGSGS